MKQPQYINIFDNGKDTLISKNSVSGQYFVITPYETLHCCKGIAAIYMSHAEQPEPKPIAERIAETPVIRNVYRNFEYINVVVAVVLLAIVIVCLCCL